MNARKSLADVVTVSVRTEGAIRRRTKKEEEEKKTTKYGAYCRHHSDVSKSDKRNVLFVRRLARVGLRCLSCASAGTPNNSARAMLISSNDTRDAGSARQHDSITRRTSGSADAGMVGLRKASE